jgi:MIP family channel proteins
MTQLTAEPTRTGREWAKEHISVVGLHGHPLEDNVVRAAIAEAIGTFALVLTIISTVVAANLDKPVAGASYGSVSIPLAGGVALALAVASLGHISGAHLNPAVTVGLAVNRRFPWVYVPAYLAAQVAGAIGAALIGWALYGDSARSSVSLGATYPAAGVPVWRALLAEAVVTFLLVLVVISVATDRRVAPGIAAVAIGAALAAAILVSGPISGAGVNPARALGPMIVAGKFTDWWVYLIAPLAGGILASAVYEGILRSGAVPNRQQA